MPKIICDNKIPFLRGVFEPFAEVVYLPGSQTDAAALRDADALITRTRTRCNAQTLEGSRVRVIASATIGFDHIDTGWCDSHGILWRNAPGCNSSSVAQYVAAALVTIARKRSLSLQNMVLGVVGVGNVGSKVARVGQALGMKVLLCDPPRARLEGSGAFVDLDSLISGSDIITLHVPLVGEGPDSTLHLFDKTRIASMRPSQVLLNASRGEVVDNNALKTALSRREILAAGLDVWEGEPFIDRELLGLLDVATPHIAGYSADGKACGTAASVHTVAQVLGLPLLGWQPSSLPLPANGSLSFSLDASDKTLQQTLTEAILHTYDIDADTLALRAAAGDFETLRGDYPVRREPSAYTVQIKGATEEILARLSILGFKVCPE